MGEKISIGIDIGGTKINFGIVKETGEIVSSERLAVNSQLNPDDQIGLICGAVKQMLNKHDLQTNNLVAIGAGVPGTVNIKTGYVEFCPNIGWEDVPAGDIFKKYLGMDVIVSQDSRCAAWSEYLLGAGRGFQSIMCVTLGTGIGCGIIVDGKILHGGMNTAGEIGHMIMEKNGRKCNCGSYGCYERYGSGTGIIQRALETYPDKFKNIPHKSESVFKLAYAGDQEMLAFIRVIVEDIAIGIANAVQLLSPEAVIISGGLCDHDELIVRPLKELIYHYGYHSWVRKKSLTIEKAQMGSDAPMIGAAMLYKA